MNRSQSLNALKSGINRLRVKGGADPSSLYDLVNGYVTISGTCESRPGTQRDAVLPAGTIGLFSFGGQLVVCSIAAKTMPAGYSCEIVVHPTDPTLELEYLHFAGPFLGAAYIAAEFVNGDVFHYWLQHRDPWFANTSYRLGDLVEPSTPNGYFYKAHRLGDPGKVWEPNVARAVGDVVEPTSPNGFEYEVIDTLGAAPRSGDSEPAWIAEDGAIVYEDTDLDSTPDTNPTSGSGTATLPPEVIDRYKNPSGDWP